MIDQLRQLRDRLDQAITAIAPLAPVLTAWEAVQRAHGAPVERPGPLPGTQTVQNGSAPPDDAPEPPQRAKRGRPPGQKRLSPEERKARASASTRLYRARRKAEAAAETGAILTPVSEPAAPEAEIESNGQSGDLKSPGNGQARPAALPDALPNQPERPMRAPHVTRGHLRDNPDPRADLLAAATALPWLDGET